MSPSAAATTSTSPTMDALIRNALASKVKGDDTSFQRVVGEVRKASSPDALSRLFRALTACVALLGRHPDDFEDLTEALFGVGAARWLVADAVTPDVTAAFTTFISHLVSANSCFLLPSLQAVVRCMMPVVVAPEGSPKPVAAAAPAPPALPKAEDDSDDGEGLLSTPPSAAPVYDALNAVLHIVPTGTTVLFNVLEAQFPHKRHPQSVHVAYVRHLLRIADTIPAVRDRVVAIVVDKLIQIDVDIKLDELPDCDDSPPVEAAAANRHVEMAAKLDVLMELLFVYLRRQCAGDKPVDTRDHMFYLMLGVFERSIILTFKSKFTQFLMFFVCQLHYSFPDLLVGRLINLARDDTRTVVLRRAAAAYLASFLARAAYLKDTTLRSALHYAAHWLVDFSTGDIKDSAAVYYAMCQALFYAVCFHAASFSSKSGGVAFLAGLPWGDIVGSHLDPLSHCVQTVATEFTRVSRALNLYDDGAAVAAAGAGKATRAAKFDEVEADNTLDTTLESFFPFDPYLLRQSARFITPVYRDWVAAATEDDNDAPDAGHVSGFTSGGGASAGDVGPRKRRRLLASDDSSDSDDDGSDDGDLSQVPPPLPDNVATGRRLRSLSFADGAVSAALAKDAFGDGGAAGLLDVSGLLDDGEEEEEEGKPVPVWGDFDDDLLNSVLPE